MLIWSLRTSWIGNHRSVNAVIWSILVRWRNLGFEKSFLRFIFDSLAYGFSSDCRSIFILRIGSKRLIAQANFQNFGLDLRLRFFFGVLLPEIGKLVSLRGLKVSISSNNLKLVFHNFSIWIRLSFLDMNLDRHSSTRTNNSLNRLNHKHFRSSGFDLVCRFLVLRFVCNLQSGFWWRPINGNKIKNTCLIKWNDIHFFRLYFKYLLDFPSIFA